MLAMLRPPVRMKPFVNGLVFFSSHHLNSILSVIIDFLSSPTTPLISHSIGDATPQRHPIPRLVRAQSGPLKLLIASFFFPVLGRDKISRWKLWCSETPPPLLNLNASSFFQYDAWMGLQWSSVPNSSKITE